MGESASIKLVKDGASLRLVISGCIDENCDLAAHLSGFDGATRLEIQTRLVTRINSAGVRNWIRALARIPSSLDLVFVDLTIPLVEQANVVPNFLPRGRVDSFFAPYACPNCEAEAQFRLEFPSDFPGGSLRPPDRQCAGCSEALEFDDLEAEYFVFLERQQTVG